MSAWLSNLDVATLFVEDLPRTKTFYQDVFGLSPIFENENSVVFNLDDLDGELVQISVVETLENGHDENREHSRVLEWRSQKIR